MPWWKTSKQIAAQRLERFLDVTTDPDDACIAVFKREDNADVGLTMKDLGELTERHRERLASKLTPPSERKWMQRECDLAQLGARRLQQVFHVSLHTAFTEQPKTAEPKLKGEGAQHYNALMQRLTTKSLRND